MNISKLRQRACKHASDHRHSAGQTLVEYGLLISLIAIVVLIVVSALGGSVTEQFSDINSGLGGGPAAVTDPCEGVAGDPGVIADSAYLSSDGTTLTFDVASTLCGDTASVNFVDWRFTSSAGGSDYGLLFDGGPGSGTSMADASGTINDFPGDISNETVTVTVYVWDNSFNIIAQDTVTTTVD